MIDYWEHEYPMLVKKEIPWGGIGLFEIPKKGDWKFDARTGGIDYDSGDQGVTKIILEWAFEVFQ